MNAPLYDAHLHLQLPPLADHAPAILTELKQRNVQRIVVNGTREEDWAAVAQLAEIDSLIIPAFGVHPWYAHDVQEEWMARLCEFLDWFPFCVGEIGLDKWIQNPDVDKQKAVFIAQLREAKRRNIPATIHCLKAWGLLLEMLQAEGPFPSGFLLHSYGGSMEMIEPFVQLGAYFSLSGYFAHPRKEKQREVFQEIPLERLLIETDAPDMLPPESLRVLEVSDKDKVFNHPANIEAVYKFAAELRGTSIENLAKQMDRNFKTLFAYNQHRPSSGGLH